MQLFKTTLGALLAASMALAGAFAGTAAPAAAQTYNTGPGVANVSVANGSVIIVRGDSGSQTAASVNAPLVPGDYVATGSGSNAEVQFDGVSMLRLAGNTQVRIVNLNPGSREVQLAAGTAELAQLQGANGSSQIDTPALTVRPNQTGDYRVSVLGNGETLVTVRSGSATVSTANGSQTLTPGSTLVAYGSSANLQNAIAFDSFDQFNAARDQAVVNAYNSNPYLSPQLAGYSNFANYGQWQNVPGYGYAWAPNNQSQTNFAPYQNGQWVWEPGYGYTWVDNAPYGYATSHYGSWFNNANYGGWLWQPPQSQYQNSPASLASAWLPAAVSFFLANGSGNGGLGNILGNLTGFLGNSGNADIGWIPLAPGEQYQPWYGQNYSYPQTALSPATNVTNVYNYYTNARYPGGIAMVPVSAWRSGSFTRTVIVRPQSVRQIVLIRGAVPVVPTTANLHYSRVAVHPVVLARTFAAPRLAAKAAVIHRVSFQTEQANIRTISVARPKVVTLSSHKAPAPHPVYHPAPHQPVHITAAKPVHHHTAPVQHHSAPAVHHTAAPAVHRTAAPAVHRTAAPAVHRTAAPAVHHTAAPAVHHTAPVVHPAVVHTAPAPHPAVVHPAPVAHPAVTHTAPVTHPAAVHPAPAVHPAKTEAHPTAKPQVHPTPHA